MLAPKPMSSELKRYWKSLFQLRKFVSGHAFNGLRKASKSVPRGLKPGDKTKDLSQRWKRCATPKHSFSAACLRRADSCFRECAFGRHGSLCANFRRPSGTRLDFLLFPALNAPGYYQTPLRGANPLLSFHRIAQDPVRTQTLQRVPHKRQTHTHHEQARTQPRENDRHPGGIRACTGAEGDSMVQLRHG